MTTAEAKNLKVGQIVQYINARATVLKVGSNGITVSYWGFGLQKDKSIRRRVPAAYLTA